MDYVSARSSGRDGRIQEKIKMIHKIAERIVNEQIAKECLNADERNKYIYAYEVLVNQVINIAIAVILALMLHEPKAVLLFLCIYIPLRKYAGGFHAKNNERCIVYSTLIIVLVIFCNRLLMQYVYDYKSIAVFTWLLLLVYIYHLAPVEAKNKRLDIEERKYYKKKVRNICIVHISFMVLNVLFLQWKGIYINALLAYSVLFFALKIEKFNTEKQKNEIKLNRWED